MNRDRRASGRTKKVEVATHADGNRRDNRPRPRKAPKRTKPAKDK